MPQQIQIVLLDAHSGAKRERRKLSHGIGTFLLRCFSSAHASRHARLILLVVDSRDGGQPHVSLLVDHVALCDSRALTTALRRLSLALRTSMNEANGSNAMSGENDAFTLAYASSLLRTAADFIPMTSDAGASVKSACISSSGAPAFAASVHVLTTMKVASVLRSMKAIPSSSTTVPGVVTKSFARVNAIGYNDMSETVFAYMLEDILGQSLRTHAQLVLSTLPDCTSPANLPLQLTLQPRLLITDSILPAPVRAMASSKGSSAAGLFSSMAMPGQVSKRPTLGPSRVESHANDHETYSALSFIAASNVPCFRQPDCPSSSALSTGPPQALHVMYSAPQLSTPQDVLYGLPYIGWGETEIDSRVDAVLTRLAESERILVCVSFDKDKMANCSYAVLPSQRRSKPTMVLIVPIAHAHTFLPMPYTVVRSAHKDAEATIVRTNVEAGLTMDSNEVGIEGTEAAFQGNRSVTTSNFAKNDYEKDVKSVLDGVPFHPFSPLDLSTLTSSSRVTNDPMGATQDRRVRFDENVHVI